MGKPIDHCGMTDAILRAMSAEDFKEAVMDRAGQLVTMMVTGDDPGEVSKFGGIEVVASAIANAVVDDGARQVARDMGADLDELKKLAMSAHISSC